MSEATKVLTSAESKRLRELARNANMAIAMHSEFVEFLREQHDAPEAEGWLLGNTGFERVPVTPESAAKSPNGKHEMEPGRPGDGAPERAQPEAVR